ncbi:transposase [Streptococcus pluranimalium]|uniref:transposase n=1 Tax=Streptococcus pluranimalium TaxID=82348 RepID=UPI0039FC7D8C
MVGIPVVYSDETGIDTYLYRKGQKIYGKMSGRRFERTSIVAGQIDGRFVAPLIDKQSMTSAFFVKWFKDQLIPSLEETHVVVMDNASFHPKKELDPICKIKLDRKKPFMLGSDKHHICLKGTNKCPIFMNHK